MRDAADRRAHPGIRHSVEQRRIFYRGREFHFVSYDGLPANEKQAKAATAPAWWLMGAGTRWEAMPFQPGQPAPEVERLLTEWIDVHVFSPSREGA
jgi:hypothetical protein